MGIKTQVLKKRLRKKEKSHNRNNCVKIVIKNFLSDMIEKILNNCPHFF